jgi:dipeptidyl aminopeptidase/acylaminoacyl peptidase
MIWMSDATPPYKPLTPEEVVDRLAPARAAISPDGALTAFTVGKYSRKAEHDERAIWLSRDGKMGQPFTAGFANDNWPVWSPDGTKLLFTSDRKERGKHRLYTIPLTGGEAQPLGELDGELEHPSFSPDGKLIAVLRTDPETPEEKKKKQEDRDDAIVVEEQPKFSRIWIVDAETGKHRCLTFGKRNVWTYAWSRDGKEIAFTATEGPEVDLTIKETPIFIVSASGGVARKVAAFPVAPEGLVFSEIKGEPVLAVRGNWHREDPADSVWIVPLSGDGEPRNLLPGFEGQVDKIVPVANDPGAVYARIVEHTHANLYKVDLGSGELEPLSPKNLYGDGSVMDGPSVSNDGKRVALIWSDGDKIEEVYTGSPFGDSKAVTEFGKELNPRLSPVEHVTWMCDGHEIEGLLHLPHGYEKGKRYPLVVEIHGGPSWQWEDHAFVDWHDWAQYLSSHGFAVLAPNPRGSTGRGSSFQHLLVDDVGGGESRDIVSGALAMVERGIADPDRLGIGGWSWGGYLTAYTITQTTIFKAAMMGAGLANMISDHGTDDIPHANLLYYPGQPYDNLDVYWESSAIKHITKCVTPTLILHGDSDDRVHPTQGAEMYRALKVLGVPVQFVRYPREPHGLKERAHQIDLMERLLAWYTKYLKPETV